MKFPQDVINSLKYYVYLYSHPKSGEIFYVGKGKGNRVFSHLKDDKESDKVNYLTQLKESGLEPRIEILIHGIEDEQTALRVEASIIDLIGKGNLTNSQSGWKSATYGRMTIDQVISTYKKEDIDIDDKVMLIRINKEFRYSINEVELYDMTRGRWVINPERSKNVKYALSVYDGVVQEVYEVIDWFKGGRTFSIRPDREEAKKEETNRWEFVGNIADENIRKKYKHKSVSHYFKKGNANPITYVNC